MKNTITLILITLLLTSCGKRQTFEMPHIISDGMILQQNSNAKIWGFATPGQIIQVVADWSIAQKATVDANGYWVVDIPTIEADFTPHKITIVAPDSTRVINNVLFGEVWLASGQSNMAHPLKGWDNDTIQNADKVIRSANDKFLRIFMAEQAVSLNNNFNLKGEWKQADINNAPDFSAVAYAFAKELRDSLNVPVGVICSAYAGSPIEPWIAPDELAESQMFDTILTNMPLVKEQNNDYIKWLQEHPHIYIGNLDGENIDNAVSNIEEFSTMPGYNYAQWPEINLPCLWEKTNIGQFDGIVWFTKKLKLPYSWCGKNIKLHIGPVDDYCKVVVNGITIGRVMKLADYQKPQVYNIPADYIKNPIIQISIRITDTRLDGGMANQPDQFFLQCANEIIPLAGKWRYRPFGEFYDNNIVLFTNDHADFDNRPQLTQVLDFKYPSALYFSMIHSIANYDIKGVLWHQGESNIGQAERYKKLFPLMIKSFRKAFNNANLPFYAAQLTPYKSGNLNGGWNAELREAQRQTIANDPNAHLLSTMDLGFMPSVHHPYKIEEGRRFARMALYHEYQHTSMLPSGPILENIECYNHLAVLKYKFADGLKIDYTLTPQFEVAGSDSIFYNATAIVNGSNLTIFSHNVAKPQFIRYAYRNRDTGSLFNAANLPAESFVCKIHNP